MRSRQENKPLALFVCILAYVLAFLLCYFLYPFLKGYHPLLTAFLLDVAATVFIFLVSLLFNNSSFYDPFWSVAPIPILVFWTIGADPEQANSIRQVLILSLVVIWAVRLTGNCILRWTGFRDEDWRYAGFRSQFGKAYWFISFLGIHLFPTLVVFAGLLPLYPALTQAPGPINLWDVIAGIVTLHAIVLETAADEQLRRFIRTNTKSVDFLKTGLWKYSRHPNYLGEVGFWVGLFLFSFTAEKFHWWYASGPVVMILLFRFISVPMIEKRMLKRRKGYDTYMKRTSALLLWHNF